MTRSGRFIAILKPVKMVALQLVIAIALLFVGLSPTSYSSVSAQSFYDKVFGHTQPGYNPTYSKSRYVAPKKTSLSFQKDRKAYAIGRVGSLKNQSQKKRDFYRVDRSGNKWFSSGGSTYRTMCVRQCDGYYFPVSFSTTRDNFKKDAATCKSSCGLPASLYVYPNPGSDIDQMVSYKTGRKYTDLKNALLFKTKFVPSCRCKPEPWSQASKEQHQKYAKANINPLKVLAKRERRAGRKKRTITYYKRGKRTSVRRRSARKYRTRSVRGSNRYLRSSNIRRRYR